MMHFKRFAVGRHVLCGLSGFQTASPTASVRRTFTSPPLATPPFRSCLSKQESVALIIARYATRTSHEQAAKDCHCMPLDLFLQEVSKAFPDLSEHSRILSWIQDSTPPLIQLTSDAQGCPCVKLQESTALELLGRVAPEDVDISPFAEEILLLAVSLLRDTSINTTVYMTADLLYQHVMRACALHTPGEPLKDIVAKKLTLPSFISLLGINDASEQSGEAHPANRVHKQRVRDRFWTFRYRDTYYIALQSTNTEKAPYFRLASRNMVSSLTATRKDFGGWGSAVSVPTKDDVYEILKYVPVHWGAFSNLNIPLTVRKKHIRASSPLMWFRRQPGYFELREINYTTEIRRSVVLHPEAHQMTWEEANELLSLRMAFWEANDLVQLDSEGKPLEEQSSFEKNVLKFFLRVCPTYFSPLGIIFQRYTKRNMTTERLLSVALAAPHEFETVHPKYATEPLVRRRGGADSERWRADFINDLESCPSDVVNIIDVFNVLTPMWDRPEYVYVRLSQKTQERLQGYKGLLELLRRHPHLFRVGDHFVCRVDASNPLAMNSKEPLPDDMTSRTILCEENPYLSPLELAKVFHYVAPQHEGCTVSFLVDAASPAMRAALPPQVISVLQQFPRLFACKENSPGEFLIYKITPSNASGRRVPKAQSETDTASVRENCEEDDSWIQEEEQAVGRELSKKQTLDEVYALVPESGVPISQLLLWTSLPVQQAANFHFGGLLKMVEGHGDMFRIVDTVDGKMIYRAPS